ncbi:efflux RND transporter periplasmic adaptor subunit [Pseudorhodoferax sp. Leaf267]|uniref:efflux RND transporter periplasmic adaptor subunit n=1 Tax=Pseudorhodoferax sp. Leaf267 TaxID=1736316 RepID=UPI000714A8D0|nr:efflux RND transporter periplasmic adaptor subunit [Pseudorhodoferax sp. Leaf267]KQP18386.1 hemolysin D [Pseudorhodoferax sp. Leaf267]
MPTQSRFAQPYRLLVPLLMALAVAGCSKGETDKAAPKAAAAPQAKDVGVVTLKAERLAFTTELSGRTAAPVVAQIRPQVGGIVQKRLFTEGSLVKAGQVLYQLDPASFDATRASALANVRKAETTLATARSVARRNAELVKIDAISQQLNEQTAAAALQAEAELAVARATEQTARINLDRTRIVAPISGWIEMSSVTSGALVTADQATPLTTIQQLDPVYVHVTQSSAELLRLKRDLASGRLSRGKSDEAPIRLLLEDGSTYPHPGRLTFSGVTVDPGTGSVTLRAVVPNPDRMLMPGMYVRAVLQEGVAEDALLVPQQGVTRAPDGSASAIVVGPDNKLVKRDIKVGRALGSRWQVLDGLAAGDRVMVEGSQRARVGDLVRASEVVPKADPAAPGNGANGANGGGNGTGPGPVASAGPAAAKLAP